MNEEQNIDNLVAQIKTYFMDYFAKTFNLPENGDVIDDIKMQSELRRILAIPSRLSYLAKGIIPTSTRDDAKLALRDVLKLVESVNDSFAGGSSKKRTIDNIVETEIDAIISILGLTVEGKNECSDRKINIIKRKTSDDDEGEDAETEIADGSLGSVIK